MSFMPEYDPAPMDDNKYAPHPARRDSFSSTFTTSTQLPPYIPIGAPPPFQNASSSTPSSSMNTQQSPPFFGLDPRFCASTLQTLVLHQEFSMSGGDFTVKTATGTPVVTCTGKYMSMSRRVEFHMPSTNEHVFTLRAEYMNFGAQNYYIEHANPAVTQHLAELTGRMKFASQGDFDIKFPNVAGAMQRNLPQPEAVHLMCRGNYAAAKMDLVALLPQGREVMLAQGKRERFRIGMARWEVQVQPGVDAAFVVAILVAVNDRRKH